MSSSFPIQLISASRPNRLRNKVFSSALAHRSCCSDTVCEWGREEGRRGGREGGGEEGREEGRSGGREGGRVKGRSGGREGGREEWGKGRREGEGEEWGEEKEGGREWGEDGWKRKVETIVICYTYKYVCIIQYMRVCVEYLNIGC